MLCSQVSSRCKSWRPWESRTPLVGRVRAAGGGNNGASVEAMFVDVRQFVRFELAEPSMTTEASDSDI
eukprot:SAG11_NODE_23160_length_394_cov_0.667797_1_plen_67_part_01